MNKSTLATLLLLIGTLFWGMTFVLVKESISTVNIYTFLGIRFLIAFLIVGSLFFRMFKELNREVFKYGLILSFFLFFSYIGQTTGLIYTTAANSAFISGLAVVFIPIFLAFYKRKLPKTTHIISVVIATLGLAILTDIKDLPFNKGDLYTLFSAVGFGIYILLTAHYSPKCNAILLSMIQLFFMAILNLLVAFSMGELKMPTTYISWQAILFTAIFATAYMYPVQNYYQKYISEVKTAIIFSLEPLFAILTAYFYQNDPLTPRVIFGGMLILSGMLFSEVRLNVSKKSPNK